MSATRAEVIARGAARLAAAGVPEAGRDARLIYRWAAAMGGPALAAALTEPAPASEVARFKQGIAARAARAPVAQIIGVREFWGRPFHVTRDVLDPRPETETLVAAALGGPPAARILDLGTGTGCILLTLLAEWPQATGLGVDISAPALAVAAGNARALGVAGRAAFHRGDWCKGLTESFGLVVANPPYIAEGELAALAPEVRLHEPAAALNGGPDGLAAYRRIAGGVGTLLAPGGRLLLEIAPSQADAVRRIFAAAGLELRAVQPDMDGRDRVVTVSHPEKTA